MAHPLSFSSTATQTPTTMATQTSISVTTQTTSPSQSTLLSSETTIATTSSAPSPAPTIDDGNRTVKLSTALGVGIGMAVLCVIAFTVVFICIRRRRRIFGKWRKQQPDQEPKGDSPDAEITKRVQSEGTVELSGDEMTRAELGNGVMDKKEKFAGSGGEVSELGDGGHRFEMEVQDSPVEIGGGFVIAELDGTAIERMKTLRKLRKEREERENDKERDEEWANISGMWKKAEKQNLEDTKVKNGTEEKKADPEVKNASKEKEDAEVKKEDEKEEAINAPEIKVSSPKD